MDTDLLKAKLIQEINQIPPSKLPDVFTFLHYFRLGLEQSTSDPQTNADHLLQFAGSWNDLDERDFSSFLNEVEQRRTSAN